MSLLYARLSEDYVQLRYFGPPDHPLAASVNTFLPPQQITAEEMRYSLHTKQKPSIP